jgi:hypothetical protein
MTIPAMAPPDKPFRDCTVPVAAPPVVDGIPDEVLEGNSGGMDTVVGRLTPTQRLLALALMQHELVELTVLSARTESAQIALVTAFIGLVCRGRDAVSTQCLGRV